MSEREKLKKLAEEADEDPFVRLSLKWREVWEPKLLLSLIAQIELAEQRIHSAYEVYANMEGFLPATAPEGYLLKIINDMAGELKSQTPSTILALLSELEQAEKRLSYVENAEDCHACAEETKQCVYHTGRDAGFSEGRMEANCDHGQYEMWLSDQIMEKTGITGKDLQEAIFKVCESAAALRTLRQASRAVIEGYSPMVCCDWCSAKFVADNYGIVSGTHEPDCEFLALAAEGGK
jgi:hypothetical protein